MTDIRDEALLAEGVREQVRTWLEKNWDSELPAEQWRERLVESGWGTPWWPKEYYGRGLPSELTRVVNEEFMQVGASGPPGGMGTWLAGPTIVEHGSHEVKRHFLRRIITGEDQWCQLFSEPGSGSDLAGAQTTAVLSGDEWIVNGQKVWTSGAQFATTGMLVCRTDWDVPKHRGISYLILDMTQPGVEVRPLKQMTGGSGFNEVFFTDARVPKDHVVGGVNDGWKVALTTLAHERAGLPQVGGGFGAMGGGRGGGGRGGGGGGGDMAQMIAAAQRMMAGQTRGRPGAGGQAVTDEMAQQIQAMTMMGRGWQGMAQIAKDRGVSGDAVVRQQLARLYILGELTRLNGLRAGAARKAGRPPGAEGSLSKLFQSAISRANRDIGLSLLGAGGMVMGSDSPMGGGIQSSALSSPSSSIAGGTDEIQHNIIGERVLGLPKEPTVDADIPFRHVKRNVQRGSQ